MCCCYGAPEQQHIAFTIGVDGVEKPLALTTSGSQHHDCRRFQIVLVIYVAHITVVSVRLLDYRLFQFLCEIIERVTHILHQRSLFKPHFHLLRIGFHLVGKVSI